jgi:quercetin dioxygenase-like cupin family protein
MKVLDPSEAARTAVAANPQRPATAVIHDSEDVRLVVFRIAPGQQVAPHTSHSTVTLTVLAGRGIISDGEGERGCIKGDVVVYERNELHGMKADTEDFLILAAIAPRPGSRA